MPELSNVPTHFAYLVAAYTVVWVGLFVYLISLGRQNRHLRREIDELRKLLGPNRA